MEGLFKIIIYFILLAIFILIPFLMGLIYRSILKSRFRLRTSSVVIAIILVQLIIIAVLYVQPIITYSPNITDDTINKHSVWARETLEKPWAGFYSRNIPILAYRFHITDLSSDYVRAEVFYFPLGKTTVLWDGLYDIVQPLN